MPFCVNKDIIFIQFAYSRFYMIHIFCGFFTVHNEHVQLIETFQFSKTHNFEKDSPS